MKGKKKKTGLQIFLTIVIYHRNSNNCIVLRTGHTEHRRVLEKKKKSSSGSVGIYNITRDLIDSSITNYKCIYWNVPGRHYYEIVNITNTGHGLL